MLPRNLQQLLRSKVIPKAPPGAAFAAIAHPAYCRSDAANTIPCGPGDSIQWWQDAVTGVWYQQATSGSRMILRQTGTKYYAESTGSSYHPWANMSGLTVAITIGAAFQMYSSVNYQEVFSNSTTGLRDMRQTTNGKLEITVNTGGDLIDANALSFNTDLAYIAACGSGGGTTTLYKSGISVASGTDSTTGSLNSVSAIGGRQNGTQIINGRIYGVSIFQTNPGIALLSTWLRSLQP